MQSVFNVKHETRVPVIHNMVDVQAKDKAQAGRSQAEATKADNIALLERLKYVQGYQAQPRTRKSVYPCSNLCLLVLYLPICLEQPFCMNTMFRMLHIAMDD